MKTLPRRLMKIILALVIAGLVLHTILLVVSGRALRRARAELLADGRPMTPESVIPGKLPDAENAAPLYESAFRLLKAESIDGQEIIQVLSTAAREYVAEPDSAEKREAFESVLSHPATVQALDLIRQAVARPGCNFNLQYELGAMLLVPHINDMLIASRTLSAKALLETRQAAGDAAWQTVEAHLHLADALRDEPILISTLVRIAIFDEAMASVRRVAAIGPPDGETADRIAHGIAAADDMAPFLRAMDGERVLYGEWAFQQLGTWNIEETLSLWSKTSRCTLQMRDLLRSYRPARQANHALYLRNQLEAARTARQPYWETDGRPVPEPELPWYSVITRLILPALDPARTRMVALQADARVTRTGLALLRHKAAYGALPPTLAEIDPSFLPEIPLDPFTGQPLLYRPEGDGFVLYSLGENLADDGGTSRTKDNRASKAFDIVWCHPPPPAP